MYSGTRFKHTRYYWRITISLLPGLFPLCHIFGLETCTKTGNILLCKILSLYLKISLNDLSCPWKLFNHVSLLFYLKRSLLSLKTFQFSSLRNCYHFNLFIRSYYFIFTLAGLFGCRSIKFSDFTSFLFYSLQAT